MDPVSGALLSTIPIGAGAFDIAYGLGAVWVPNLEDGTVQRIDPATNTVVATIPVLGAYGIGVDPTTVWVVDLDGKVSRIDPLTNTVTTSIFTQATGADIVATTGAIWVSHFGTTAAQRQRQPDRSGHEPGGREHSDHRQPREDGRRRRQPLGGTHNPATVVRINPTTNAILSKVTVIAGVYTIAATTGAVWAVHNLTAPEGATAPPNGTVTRVGY